MASWNDKQYNSQLTKCPVCPAMMANKKIQKHVMKCYEDNKESMDRLGVIQCPFVRHHILPITFLNHHLEGNCQGVLNHLRSFYQKDLFKDYAEAPEDYQAFVPDKYLNRHNKNLLFMLEQHLYGDYKRRPANRSEGGQQESGAENPHAPQDVD